MIAAGAIVVVAIAGLLATGIPFVGRMGLGSAIMVAAVAVGAVTVLPVLMGAFAKRLRPRKPEHVAPSPRFARWGRRIVARPWLAAGLGTLVLLLLAAPFAGPAARPARRRQRPRAARTTRQAYDTLAEGFGPGFNGPLVLAASVPAGGDGTAALERVQRAVAADPGVAAVAPAAAQRGGRRGHAAVIPRSSPQDERTSELVERLRDDGAPARRGGLRRRGVRRRRDRDVRGPRRQDRRRGCRSSSRSSSG